MEEDFSSTLRCSPSAWHHAQTPVLDPRQACTCHKHPPTAAGTERKPPTLILSLNPQNACRHRTNRNMLLAKVMAKQPWADGPSVKSELDRQVDAVLGPKTEADERPLPKAKPAKKVWALWGCLACQI